MILAAEFDGGGNFAKAMERARRVKPEVHFMFSDVKASKVYYLVKRTDKISDYVVRLWFDPDEQRFVECECYLGKPPIDSQTKLPAFDPAPCTHAAALLLFIAEKEKE